MLVVTPEHTRNILLDRVVTHAKIVVDYCSQKSDMNRVSIMTGGNLLKYPGNLSTRTADLTTYTMVWNSVISTRYSEFMGLDIIFLPRYPD